MPNELKVAVVLYSDVMRSCPFCRGTSLDGEKLELAAKHLQESHSLTCMHVGTETTYSDVTPRPRTVAVFGSMNPPVELPPAEFVINRDEDNRTISFGIVYPEQGSSTSEEQSE